MMASISEAGRVSRTALIEEFFEFSRQKRVASFDVFDTALWRRVAQPTHVFALVEGDLVEAFGSEIARDFAQARVDAELLARELGQREHGHVEVTLDEIYDVLPRFWARSPELVHHARQAELKTEVASVAPEPAILEVYRRLKASGTATIFVSDIYLGTQDVRALLVECGYDARDPLFVSSEHRRAKWDGSIWDVVSESLGVAKADIAHIGDNRPVDVDAAIRSGVAAVHWPGRSHHHKPVAPVSRWIAPLSALKVLNQTSSAADGEAIWGGLGRAYGTVIFGAFLLWLAERAAEADHVYFCSRDGQILLKLWRELIAPNRPVPSASYLHVSRRTLCLPRAEVLNTQTIEFLCSGAERRSVRTYLERAALLDHPEAVARAEEMFGSLDRVLEGDNEIEAIREFFRASARELAQAARQHRALAERYLEQEGLFEGGRRVIVDLGWRGSLQRSLVDFLQRRNASTVLSGLYYGLTRDASVNRASAGWMEAMVSNDFMDAGADLRLRQMVTILEQFHGADHGSVWGYSDDGGRVVPVLRDNAVEQHQYRTKILPFQQAAEAELRKIFAGEHVIRVEQLTPECAWAALIDLCLFPSLDEARALGGLRSMDGFEHSGAGVPLAAPLPDPSRQEAEAILRGHVWISGSFKNWIATHPEFLQAARELARRQGFDGRWSAQFQ
jgi:FMN phosphatase YigB (HAD superfamily)